MVGLNEFGEAAWSLEQMLNSWLADQKATTDEFRALSTEAMNGFASWIADIAANQDGAWSASAFRVSADAMRTEGRYSPAGSGRQGRRGGKSRRSRRGAAGAPQRLFPCRTSSWTPVCPPPPARQWRNPCIRLTDLDFDLVFETWTPRQTKPAEAVSEPAAEIAGIDFDSLAAISASTEITGGARPLRAIPPVAGHGRRQKPSSCPMRTSTSTSTPKQCKARRARQLPYSILRLDASPAQPPAAPQAAETFDAEPVQTHAVEEAGCAGHRRGHRQRAVRPTAVAMSRSRS
jgi:hypothetical protein